MGSEASAEGLLMPNKNTKDILLKVIYIIVDTDGDDRVCSK